MVSRQEPGRNFGGIVEFGPHNQAEIGVPAAAAALGAKITAAVAGIAVVMVLAANTEIAPLLLVCTLVTYLEVAVDDSQPQLPAVGNDPVCAVCTDSVMLVRQLEAANTNSDTFARTV